MSLVGWTNRPPPPAIHAGTVGGARPTRLGPARSLDQDVVAGPALGDVLAGAADQDVVPRAAGQRVVAAAADEDVIAVAAVGREGDRGGGEAGGVHRVVAAQGIDRQPVVGSLGARDVHPGGES